MFIIICVILSLSDDPQFKETLTITVTSSILTILWSLYEIFVIHSIETTYREDPERALLFPQPAIPNHNPTRQQGPVIINTQPSHDYFNVNPPPQLSTGIN